MSVLLLRRLAAVALAMVLSLAVLITTPSNAHAFTEVKDVKPTFVMGAQKTLSPAITTGGKFIGNLAGGPWLKAAKMLGMAAFSTSDLWMPVVTGNFGTPPESKEMSTADGYTILPGFRLSGYTYNGGRSITMHWTYSGTDNPNSGYVATFFNCRQVVARTNKPVGFMSTFYFLWSFGLGGGSIPSGSITGNACPVDTVVQSGTMGPEKSIAPGPENQLQHGNMGSFDPTSPDASYKSRSECIDTSGVKTWIEAETSAANNGHVLVPSCVAAGKGVGTGRTQLLTQAPGQTTWDTVWDTGPEPLSDPSTPLCDPGKTSSGCTLSIEIDGKPCVVGDPECEQWPEVNQGDQTQTRVKCKFGPYTLPLASCGLLEPAYQPGGAPVNDPNTDGDPGTKSWADPSGNPIAAPAPAPVIAPAPGAVPGTGGQLGPSADEQSKQCYPTGWAMANPVEWVMKPVGCALRAAFVPSTQAVQAQGQRVQTKLSTVGFGPMTQAFLGTVDAGVVEGGCMGPQVSFDMMGVSHSFYPFQACSHPMSMVAGISYAVSCIGIVLFGGLGMIRALSSAFGFNFTMGSKGGVDA